MRHIRDGKPSLHILHFRQNCLVAGLCLAKNSYPGIYLSVSQMLDYGWGLDMPIGKKKDSL
ncbi:hypothetical protein Hdeb2414_s1132g00984581 [Helianthus debilis subsp. tardiflorus]